MYLLDKEMGKGGTQHPALETKEHGTEGCGWREVLGGQREGSNQERPDGFQILSEGHREQF